MVGIAILMDWFVVSGQIICCVSFKNNNICIYMHESFFVEKYTLNLLMKLPTTFECAQTFNPSKFINSTDSKIM